MYEHVLFYKKRSHVILLQSCPSFRYVYLLKQNHRKGQLVGKPFTEMEKQLMTLKIDYNLTNIFNEYDTRCKSCACTWYIVNSNHTSTLYFWIVYLKKKDKGIASFPVWTCMCLFFKKRNHVIMLQCCPSFR